MSLEQAVHQRWAAADDLASLLPAENVTTGIASSQTLPRATIARKLGRSTLRTNAGATLEEVTLRIEVWHEDHDAGRKIAEEVDAAFDGAVFALSSPSRTAQMRRTDQQDSQHDDAIWRFAIEFFVSLHLTTGA
jgi:hypothetical protein